MKISGLSCITKKIFLVFLGHPNVHVQCRRYHINWRIWVQNMGSKERHYFIELIASGLHKKVIHQRCSSMTAFEAGFINLMPGMRYDNESSIAMASFQYTPYPSLQIWPIGNLVKM